GVNRGEADSAKIEAVRVLVARVAGRTQFVIPVQAQGELFGVLLKAGADRAQARDVVVHFANTFDSADSAGVTLFSALDLAVAHRLQVWDALIVCAAAEAGCSMLLSEDMQDGFVWRGLTLVDPFAPSLHPRLAALAG
ncbi:MAG: PIN domain-containing protein, partial [Candidatus Dormibacteria bacterium]